MSSRFVPFPCLNRTEPNLAKTSAANANVPSLASATSTSPPPTSPPATSSMNASTRPITRRFIPTKFTPTSPPTSPTFPPSCRTSNSHPTHSTRPVPFSRHNGVLQIGQYDPSMVHPSNIRSASLPVGDPDRSTPAASVSLSSRTSGLFGGSRTTTPPSPSRSDAPPYPHATHTASPPDGDRINGTGQEGQESASMVQPERSSSPIDRVGG